MHSSKSKIKLLTLALSLMLGFCVRPTFGGLEMVLNGKDTSTNDIRKNIPIPMMMFRLAGRGKETVPVKTAVAYQTRRPSAQTGARGLAGKIGDVLTDGRWRFQVLGLQTPDSYSMKTDAEPYDYTNRSSFDLNKRVFNPRPDYKLVVIECSASNTQKSGKRLWVSVSDGVNVRTALVDTGGSSYLPIGYDFVGGPIQTKPLQPGETISFAVVFSVPQSAQLKELIFTLAANGEREQSKDARVSLDQGKGATVLEK